VLDCLDISEISAELIFGRKMEGSIILFDFQGVKIGHREVKASVYNLKQIG